MRHQSILRYIIRIQIFKIVAVFPVSVHSFIVLLYDEAE